MQIVKRARACKSVQNVVSMRVCIIIFLNDAGIQMACGATKDGSSPAAPPLHYKTRLIPRLFRQRQITPNMSQQSTFFNIQDVLDEASQEVRESVPSANTLSQQGHMPKWCNGDTPATLHTKGSIIIFLRANGGAALGQDELPVSPSQGASVTVNDAKTALKGFAREFVNSNVSITNALVSTCGAWTAKFANPTGEPTDDDPRQGVRAVVLMYNINDEPAPTTNGFH